MGTQGAKYHTAPCSPARNLSPAVYQLKDNSAVAFRSCCSFCPSLLDPPKVIRIFSTSDFLLTNILSRQSSLSTLQNSFMKPCPPCPHELDWLIFSQSSFLVSSGRSSVFNEMTTDLLSCSSACKAFSIARAKESFESTPFKPPHPAE